MADGKDGQPALVPARTSESNGESEQQVRSEEQRQAEEKPGILIPPIEVGIGKPL